MAKKKHFIILGLGTFGSSLAKQLSKNGCRVTGVDRDRIRVESLKHELFEAIVADVTDRTAIEHLELAKGDAVFISLGEGEDMSPSLLAVLHSKDLGAHRLVVKGLNAEHGKILRAMGVDRVVFPESEMAVELADRETWPNILNNLPIDPEYSIVEISSPESLAGKSLQEADLRRRFNIHIVAIKNALSGQLAMVPDPNFRFTGDELLVVLGTNDQIEEFRSHS